MAHLSPQKNVKMKIYQSLFITVVTTRNTVKTNFSFVHIIKRNNCSADTWRVKIVNINRRAVWLFYTRRTRMQSWASYMICKPFDSGHFANIFFKKLHELKWPTRTRSMIKIYTQFWPVLRQEVCAPLITDTDRLASEVRRACNCVVLCQLLWSLACYIWSTVATVRGTDRRATSRAGFTILYSTLFAVEQYSSKKE